MELATELHCDSKAAASVPSLFGCCRSTFDAFVSQGHAGRHWRGGPATEAVPPPELRPTAVTALPSEGEERFQALVLLQKIFKVKETWMAIMLADTIVHFEILCWDLIVNAVAEPLLSIISCAFLILVRQCSGIVLFFSSAFPA